MGNCRGQVGHVYAIVLQRREKGVGRRAATPVCVHANLPREVLSSVDRYARFPSCVPAVFSLPQGSQVALQGDTCVCVYTQRQYVCIYSVSSQRYRRRALAVSLTRVCK